MKPVTKYLTVLTALIAVYMLVYALLSSQPNVSGYVWNEEHVLVTNATVLVAGRTVTSSTGYFAFHMPREGSVVVQAPGFSSSRVTLVPDSNPFDVQLRRVQAP